jgi:hypothetical protein
MSRVEDNRQLLRQNDARPPIPSHCRERPEVGP